MNDVTLRGALEIIACVLFLVGLKLMGKQASAKRGNFISAAGMILAVIVAVSASGVDYLTIAITVAVGSVIGAFAAVRVKMTAMPEMVALFNGSGGLASLAVGLIELLPGRDVEVVGRIAAALAVIIGGVAFSGSIVAFAKLAGKLNTKPIIFPFQLTLSGLSAVATLVIAGFAVPHDAHGALLVVLSVLSVWIGVLSVIRIGGGDMPVVVSLLNSYSGVAAAFAGLALASPVLIVAGTLVGAAGLMLTGAMCKAMNRSLSNVLFAGFGATVATGGTAKAAGEVKPITAPDTYALLEAARSVIIVPGYGMAVAQAQHAVKELAELLIENGADVRFVIHPVAGRMPGHMNVLLAEAGVEYEQLAEPGDVNPTMENVDVALVIGANDVVNPDAREDQSSPLFGMPIVDVDKARTVVVSKRSMSSGFAGVENSLFYRPNTRMLFGDAQKSMAAIVAEFKQA
ncbi:MAG: NAD(P)(+) transhydrogenase (Re/Si-specific) subunit beta [Phycisphaerales bacterium]|nr:NAD(P)(+) transhydrogenase (Re/Si-specific) subunit beta [Phycisphaerales bacterium]MCB9837537.1 NAD(P)(+) transhydrogenase (Re/Si-specific) subunit beta [Phycisphaera sp.]